MAGSLTGVEKYIEQFRDTGWTEWLNEDELRRMWEETNGVADHKNFTKAIRNRKFNECVAYECVNGNCTILWHPFFGNTGGVGIPGCSCDDMEDPRGVLMEETNDE